MPAPSPNKPAPAPKYGLSDNPVITSAIGMVAGIGGPGSQGHRGLLGFRNGPRKRNNQQQLIWEF